MQTNFTYDASAKILKFIFPGPDWSKHILVSSFLYSFFSPSLPSVYFCVNYVNFFQPPKLKKH